MRRRRQMITAVAAMAAGATLALTVAPGTAWASSTAPQPSSGAPAGGSQASLQAEAATLTEQIQSQGTRLDQLAERYDAARLRAAQIDAALARSRQRLAATDASLASTEAILRQQAVAAYVSAGAPERAGLSVDTTGQLIIVNGYAESLTGSEHSEATQLRQLRTALGHQSVTLAAEQRSARAAVVALASSRNQAAGAQASLMSTLSGLRGQLASMVAADQAAQAQSTARSEQAVLASTGQLPPSTPAVLTGTKAPAGGGEPSTTTTVPYRPPSPSTTAPAPTLPPTIPPTTRYVTTTAPPTTMPASTTTTVPGPPGNDPAPGWQTAVSVAEAQIGKPYQWGGAGPNTFDCSGLVQYSWGAAGVYFPHLAQDQYDMTARIPLYDLLPGDLVFFGTPTDVYHVGIYIGGGDMVDAPETGQDVQIQSIYWSTLLGGGRVQG